jgi:hypothetical protein
MPSFIAGFLAGAFLTLAVTSRAEPPGGGNFRGHGAFRMGSGIRRHSEFRPGLANNRNRRFLDRDHRFFVQQFASPFFWYPFGYPDDYSYLDSDPNDTYQYWDSSSAAVPPESSVSAGDHRPVVVIINKGNAGPTDSNPNAGYLSGGYSSNDPAGQQRTPVQDPNEKIGPDPRTFALPAQPAQTAVKSTQTTSPAQAGTFGNLVLVSWLEDAGKYILYVRNTETNEVQKITSEANLDKFRIVEVHPNPDPQLFEAVISNGSQQGPVRFRF